MNADHTALVERYAAGSKKLRDATAGLTAAQADALPVPGTWSIRQIVVHLAHAEIFLVARILQIVAEDVPLLMNWDENAFIARLPYAAVPVDAALATIEGLRATTAAALRALDDAEFGRAGIHSKIGKMTMADMVKRAADHLEHHLAFVEKKRTMVESGMQKSD